MFYRCEYQVTGCLCSSEVLLEVSNPGVQAIAWSPLGSHLLTWQRPQKDVEQGNLIVWDATTGAEVARFNQKSYSRDVSLLFLAWSLPCSRVEAQTSLSSDWWMCVVSAELAIDSMVVR